MSAVVLFASNAAISKQIISQVGCRIATFFSNSVTLENLAKRSENDLHIAKESDFFDVLKIVADFSFPSNGIASADLSKPAKSLSYGVALALFGSHKDHVANKLRSRPNYSHIALEDVEQFREFIKARAAEELAVGVQPHVVGEQVAVGVLLVRHRAELDEFEDFFVKARARLREEGVAMHLDGTEDGEHEQQRAQAEDGCQSAEKIEGAFKEAGVHVLNVTGSFASLRITE